MKQDKIKYDIKIVEKTKKKGINGVTLVALVVTILFSYDERIKCSDSKGSLLEAIW